MIELWKCDCGITHERPWTTCFRCNADGRRKEAEGFRAIAVEARILEVTPYGDLVVNTADNRTVRIRDAGISLRCGEARSKEDLVTTSMRLKDENKELLVENAKLRRQIEKSGDTKGVTR